jgi:hypothetical protein
MHVKEFILGILGVECGPRPRTEHFLKRESHALLAENTSCKTERPGYEPDEYDQMCGLLKDRRQADGRRKGHQPDWRAERHRTGADVAA